MMSKNIVNEVEESTICISRAPRAVFGLQSQYGPVFHLNILHLLVEINSGFAR